MHGRILFLALSLSFGVAQADPAPSFDNAKAIVGEVTKIVSPNGIDKLVKIPVNGTEQWISIRGRDLRNPILLFVHGGPAAPEMPTRWTFQSGWEDYFTVVQWDQRGSGKSYLANDPAKIGPTLTIAQMTDDEAVVVQYLRRTFHRQKIFLMAHSWGTSIGLTLAHQHPEWLYAYIGMGQIIDMRAGERESYDWTLHEAEQRGDAAAVKELRAIAPYPEANGTLPLAKIGTERKWNIRSGGLTYGRTSYDYYENAGKLSPDYSDAERAAIDKGSALSLPALLPQLAKFDYSQVTEYGCPIVMFEGRHDTTTPSDIVADWFARVKAPARKFVWFENSAHMVQIEEPGRVLVHLVEDVLPLAGEAAPH